MKRIPGFAAENTLYSNAGRYDFRASVATLSGVVEPAFDPTLLGNLDWVFKNPDFLSFFCCYSTCRGANYCYRLPAYPWCFCVSQDCESSKLRRLLSHTAGMTVPSVGGYQAGEYMPTTVQALNGEKTSSEPVRVDRVPGKEFHYSGGGQVVVQQLLMDVTGKSFPALMHELLFERLAMTHSTFVRRLLDDHGPPERLARLRSDS